MKLKFSVGSILEVIYLKGDLGGPLHMPFTSVVYTYPELKS